MARVRISALEQKNDNGVMPRLHGTTPLTHLSKMKKRPPPGRDATPRESPAISLTRDPSWTPTLRNLDHVPTVSVLVVESNCTGYDVRFPVRCPPIQTPETLNVAP
jgi:hypothetical protein